MESTAFVHCIPIYDPHYGFYSQVRIFATADTHPNPLQLRLSHLQGQLGVPV